MPPMVKQQVSVGPRLGLGGLTLKSAPPFEKSWVRPWIGSLRSVGLPYSLIVKEDQEKYSFKYTKKVITPEKVPISEYAEYLVIHHTQNSKALGQMI